MDQAQKTVCKQVVAMVLFVHEDNRQDLFRSIVFAMHYMALISYREDCKDRLRSSEKLDQVEVNENWQVLENKLNELLTTAGNEIFTVTSPTINQTEGNQDE